MDTSPEKAGDNIKKARKSKTISIVLAVFAGLLIVVELSSPNFGFSSMDNAGETAGSSLFAIIIYAVGAKLIYDAFKKM